MGQHMLVAAVAVGAAVIQVQPQVVQVAVVLVAEH
jgi:hypothetical protein